MKNANLGRRLVLQAGVCAAAAGAFSRAAAQGGGGARIIATFPAGGVVDSLSRILAQRFSPKLQGQVIVLNQPGANGLIAVNTLTTSPADGNTMLVAPMGLPVINPLVQASPGPRFGKDYVPVGIVAKYSFAIAVPANHPAKSVPELIAWLKGNPSKASFGITGAGNIPHFLGVSLAKRWGVAWTPVPYKGAPPMKLDMLSGLLPSAISGDAEFLAEQQKGSLRVLATTGTARSRIMPDAPTLHELGIDFDATGWYGMYVRAGTSLTRINELNGQLRQVLADPAVVSQFMTLGFEVGGGSNRDLDTLVQADIAKWQPVIKASGFTATN